MLVSKLERSEYENLFLGERSSRILPGQYFHAETQTHYNYFRDYNPQTGRYQQSDPLGWSGHTDAYGYVKGAPLTYVDLNGEAYKRPGRTSNKQQKDAMQGQPCSTCGAVGQKNFADHKTPLVVEHCFTGSVDRKRMFELDAVRPQCQRCSCSQGGKLRALYARLKKCFPGL